MTIGGTEGREPVSERVLTPAEERAQIELAATNNLQDLLARLEAERLARSSREVKDHEQGLQNQDATERDRARQPGSQADPESLNYKRQYVEESMRQTLNLIRNDPSLRPAAGTLGRKIVDSIINNVSDEVITPQSAPYLFEILTKALRNDPSLGGDPLRVLSTDEMKYLLSAHRGAGESVLRAIVNAADDIKTPDEITQYVAEISPRPDPRTRTGDKVTIKGHEIDKPTDPEGRRNYLETFTNLPRRYFMTDQQANTAYAILSPENFIEFIDITDEEIRRELGFGADQVLDEHQQLHLDHEVSEKIELSVTQFFDELFVPLDESKPTELFEHIAREDYWEGFGTVLSRFDTIISSLPNYLSQLGHSEKGHKYKDRKFYVEHSILRDQNRKYASKREEGKSISFISQERVNHADKVEVGLPDFVRRLKVMITVEREWREFYHNSRALFYQPVDEKRGFYAQLRDYSTKMTMFDLDEFLSMPDHDIFMTAYSMYAKYLEEEFARYDWRHQAGMFQAKEGFLNKMESEVLQMLKIIYSDRKKWPEWRLRRALSMGVGASLGLFLTETEIAAYADSTLKAGGGDNYYDYYRNGAGPLKTLNPFPHAFWRWQKEHSTVADLLFLPLMGKGMLNWDHEKLFIEMQKNKDAYFERDFTPLDDGRIRLMDIMNPGQVGGLHTRGGWRYDGAMEHLVVHYEHGGVPGTKINFLDTWKSFEYVGFEPLYNLPRLMTEGDFLKPGGDVAARRALFKYIYQKYTMPGASGAEFDAYFGKVEAAARRKVWLDPSLHKINKKPSEGVDVYLFEINRALTGLLKQRLPTKFLRLERGRLTPGGKDARLWDRVQREMGPGFLSDAGVVKYDLAIKDITTAEALHRNAVSKKMEEHLKAQRAAGRPEKFSEFDFPYHLTEAEMVKLLDDTFSEAVKNEAMRPEDKADRIANAKRAYSLMTRMQDRDYLDRFALKLLDRMPPPGLRRSTVTDLPFAVAPEEFDIRFADWSSSGPGNIKRAYTDISAVEERVIKVLEEYQKLLRKVANGEKDTDPDDIVAAIQEVKDTLEAQPKHGSGYATEIAGHLAKLAIMYFKTDTKSRFIGTKLFALGSPSSLAGELSGVRRGIREWDVLDVNKFIAKLEKARIIPRKPFDISKVEVSDREIFGRTGIPFFGKEISFGKIYKKGPHHEYSGKTLRREAGATGWHIAWEILNKWMPLILAGVVVMNLWKAAKEDQDDH